MVKLKFTQIGNSQGLVFPKELMAQLGASKGTEVFVIPQPDGLLLTSADPDFAKAIEFAQEGMKKYRNALSELAK